MCESQVSLRLLYGLEVIEIDKWRSVRIDVDEMLAKDAVRFQGEEELLSAIAEERNKKRQHRRPSAGDNHTPRKRAKPDSQTPSGGLVSSHTPIVIEATDQSKPVKVPGKRTPKAVIDISSNQQRAKANSIKDPNSFPCLFCPGFARDDLLPVFDPSDSVKARWKPRHGEVMAHHSCALAIPGVGIEDREVPGGLGTFVVGVENVESARWKLVSRKAPPPPKKEVQWNAELYLRNVFCAKTRSFKKPGPKYNAQRFVFGM